MYADPATCWPAATPFLCGSGALRLYLTVWMAPGVTAPAARGDRARTCGHPRLRNVSTLVYPPDTEMAWNMVRKLI
jgi:hypothetical protein